MTIQPATTSRVGGMRKAPRRGRDLALLAVADFFISPWLMAPIISKGILGTSLRAFRCNNKLPTPGPLPYLFWEVIFTRAFAADISRCTVEPAAKCVSIPKGHRQDLKPQFVKLLHLVQLTCLNTDCLGIER